MWVYKDFDWHRELPKLAATRWRWVTLAVVADILVYVCQGWRWSTLLSPLAQVSPWKTTQAIYIGLFANEILPLRSGEVIRCYLQRRWTGLPLEVVLSSALIERLLDGVWLASGFWLISQFLELPRGLEEGSWALVGLLAVVGGLLTWAILYKGHAHETLSRFRGGRVLQHVVDGVHTMGISKSFPWTILLSLVYLALQVLPIYLLMIGYGLPLSAGAAVVVLVILRLGTIVPNAPGNVGTFQFLAIQGLRAVGVRKEDATGFATFLFLVVTVPLLLAGFVALLLTRMRLGDIHEEAHQTMSGK